MSCCYCCCCCCCFFFFSCCCCFFFFVVVVVVVVTSALIALETACFPNSVRWRRPLLWVSPIQTPSLQSTCRWCAWWLYASNGRDVTWTAWKIWCPVVMVFWVKFKVIEFVAQCQLMNQVNRHIWIQQTVKDHQWPQGQCRWHVKKDPQFVSCTLPFSCYKLWTKKQLELGGFNRSLWLPLQVERLLGAVPSPLNWLFAWESKSIIKQNVNLEPAKPPDEPKMITFMLIHDALNYHYVRDAFNMVADFLYFMFVSKRDQGCTILTISRHRVGALEVCSL